MSYHKFYLVGVNILYCKFCCKTGMMWIKYKKNTSLKIHHYTCSISKYFGSCRGKPCITKPEFSGIIHYSHCTSSNVSYTYLLFSIFNDVFLVIKRKNWVNREAGLFQYTELSVSLWIHSNVQLLFQFHRSSFSMITKRWSEEVLNTFRGI